MNSSTVGPAAAAARFDPTLITNFAVNSSFAESYRVLRTALMARSDAVRDGGTLLVTSTGRGEGKSLTSANLGIMLSRTHKKVVIVDADLRRPALHQLFGIDAQGYSAKLESPDSELHVTDGNWVRRFAVPVLDDLSVVTAGDDCMHPSELLGSTRFMQFLRGLREQFDIVVIDSPPVGIVTDAAVLAPHVDGVLFVVDYRSSNRRSVQRALHTLEQAGANVLGTALNRYTGRQTEAYGELRSDP